MQYLKKQKGAISLFTVLAMLFFLVFVLSAYTIVTRRMQTQTMALEQTQKIYNPTSPASISTNTQVIDSGEVIPIYTLEQFELIGSGKYVQVNDKLYKFGKNETETDNYAYTLKNNVLVDFDDYFGQENPEEITDLNEKFSEEEAYVIDKASYDVYFYKPITDETGTVEEAYWKEVDYKENANNATPIFSLGSEEQPSTLTNDPVVTNEIDTNTIENEASEYLLLYNTNENETFDVNRYTHWKKSEDPTIADQPATISLNHYAEYYLFTKVDL